MLPPNIVKREEIFRIVHSILGVGKEFHVTIRYLLQTVARNDIFRLIWRYYGPIGIFWTIAKYSYFAPYVCNF